MIGLKRIAGALFVAALFAIVCNAAFAATALPKAFKDKDAGFSFNYPDKWETNAPQAGVVIVMDATVQNGATAAFMSTLGEAQAVNIKKEDLVANMTKSMEGFKLLSYQKTKLQGNDCLVVDYQFLLPTQNAKVSMRQRQYAFDKGDRNYAMTFTSTDANFGKYDATFKAMADSFRP